MSVNKTSLAFSAQLSRSSFALCGLRFVQALLEALRYYMCGEPHMSAGTNPTVPIYTTPCPSGNWSSFYQPRKDGKLSQLCGCGDAFRDAPGFDPVTFPIQVECLTTRPWPHRIRSYPGYKGHCGRDIFE